MISGVVFVASGSAPESRKRYAVLGAWALGSATQSGNSIITGHPHISGVTVDPPHGEQAGYGLVGCTLIGETSEVLKRICSGSQRRAEAAPMSKILLYARHH
jgi:hypothetical protein